MPGTRAPAAVRRRERPRRGLPRRRAGRPGKWGRTQPDPDDQFPQAIGLGETWDPELVASAAALGGARGALPLPERQRRARGHHRARAQRRHRRATRAGAAPRSATARTRIHRRRWPGVRARAAGRPPALLAGGVAAEALSREQQRERPRALVVDFDERLFREYYSVPFRKGVARAARARFMAAYNAVQRRALPRAPDARDDRARRMGAGRHHLHRRRRLHAAGDDAQGLSDLAAAAAACCAPASASFSTTIASRA